MFIGSEPTRNVTNIPRSGHTLLEGSPSGKKQDQRSYISLAVVTCSGREEGQLPIAGRNHKNMCDQSAHNDKGFSFFGLLCRVLE